MLMSRHWATEEEDKNRIQRKQSKLVAVDVKLTSLTDMKV